MVTKQCIQTESYVVGVRTYGMACDDLFQCAGLPKNICCTKKGQGKDGIVIRCSDSNFPAEKIDHDNFGPECAKLCSPSGSNSADRNRSQPSALLRD